jgi:O-antigen ligase
MSGAATGLRDVRTRRIVADGLAAALAVSLPWSTSATAILVVLFLLTVATTLSLSDIRRELATPAGAFPVALWALAALGMLWSDASWSARLAGWGAFHKLLAIPVLLAHFRSSQNGRWAILAFLAAAAALMLTSWFLALWPGLAWRGKFNVGVPVKDYISQSGVFTLCIVGLMWAAFDLRGWRRAAALALAGAMLANIAFVATARTALVVIAVLALILAFRRLRWVGVGAVSLLGAVLAGGLWMSSPYLRDRVNSVGIEVGRYVDRSATSDTSAALRLEFWRKSLGFVAEAPLAGHGVGTVVKLFDATLPGASGVSAVASANPHNQTLMVAIQLGLIGVVLLYAMWLSHLLLFRDPSFVAWLGLVVVVQNIVGSLFNSHLSDFSQGWLYVVGVGVLGGMTRAAFSPDPFPTLRRPAPRSDI